MTFFDGTSTGELTSHMTNEKNAMTEPLNWCFRQFLKTGIILFGSFIMRFYTSWRLSILAFTTIAPLTYITNIYAEWSKH